MVAWTYEVYLPVEKRFHSFAKLTFEIISRQRVISCIYFCFTYKVSILVGPTLTFDLMLISFAHRTCAISQAEQRSSLLSWDNLVNSDGVIRISISPLTHKWKNCLSCALFKIYKTVWIVRAFWLVYKCVFLGYEARKWRKQYGWLCLQVVRSYSFMKEIKVYIRASYNCLSLC